MTKIVGIDLGTTNSCVAVMEGGNPVVIANAEGTRTTPSVVAFNKKRELLIGEIAKRQAIINYGNTFHSVKRLMGRDMAELETEAKELSFGIKGDQSRVKIECPILDKTFSPEEISARILQKLATDASDYLGQKVTQAIVTVPAYFNDSQRQATRDAGQIAGLDVIRIITEPVAAALAYGLNIKKRQFVLVFDLGGGTFDVSVLEISDDNVFEVLSTSGDTHLGGDDFDNLIVDFLADDFKAIEGIDLRQDKQALQRLTEAAEKAKIELSYATVSEISIPFITATADGPKHLDISITREQFENLSAPMIRRCLIAVDQALKDTELSSSTELDQILFVGGSTRIPAIEDMIFNKLGKKPNKTVNPDEIVALGAAIQAAVLGGENNDVLLLDATTRSLGIRTESDRVSVLIPKNTTTPTKVTKAFATASDNQTSVKINIIQGDNEHARDNKSLGIFTLSGLRPAPRGEARVNVTFDCDSNGILSVTAIDENTGKEQSITISDTSRLEPAEIDQMAKDVAEDTDSFNHTAELSAPLIGSELLSKVKALGDVNKSVLAKACGYMIKRKDGSDKILFTAFYEALLSAKGVDVESLENKQDDNLLLTREEEKLKTDFIGYPEFGTENIILSGEERAKAELKVLLSWYSRCLSFMFDIGEKLFQKGESSSQFISFADTLHIIEIELKRRQSMFAKVFRQLDYDHIQELIHKTSSSEDVMWKWFVNEIEKLSIDDAVQIDEDTGAVRLADEYTVGVIDGKYMIRKSNLVSTETTHNVQYTELINATFKLLTRLVIDDKEFDQRIYSAYSAEYRDKFKIPLQKSWFDSVIALKGSAYMSLKYEVFSEFFSDDINKITDRIMEYCSNPSWDADDELPGHIDGLLLGIQELYPLCKYLSISEQDVLKLLFTNDGTEIDSVTINPELIRCVEEFESGEVDKEEFEDELKEFDDNNPMFEVELHLTMKSCLNHDNCRKKFEEEFNDCIPGIENIESAEYAKFIQLCNAFAASLVKEFIPHSK